MALRRPEIGPFTEDFSLRVKYSRLRSGMTLRDLAERMDMVGFPMSKDALSQIETGYRRVTLDDAAALCMGLGIDLDMRCDSLLEQSESWYPKGQAALRRTVESQAQEKAMTMLEAAAELRSEHHAAALGHSALAMESASALFEVMYKAFRTEKLGVIESAKKIDRANKSEENLAKALAERRVVRALDILIAELKGTDG